MEKGHVLAGILLLLLMVTLPAVAVSSAVAAPAPAPLSQEADTVTVYRTHTDTVETLSMADYLFGVVAAEIPMSYPDEAIKAQIIAAHTLARYRMAERQENPLPELKGALLSDSHQTDQEYAEKQVALAKWGDKASEYETKLKRFIEQTGGLYIDYNGAPALAAYHSISAGRTEASENVWGSAYPYLVPVESVGDLTAEGYISTKEMSFGDCLSVLKKQNAGTGDSLTQPVNSDYQRSESGTVLTVKLAGQSFTGKEIRTAFSLRSANFDIKISDQTVVFTVRGYGHLTGMSQYGAKTMAEQGSTAKEILTWYYKGCDIKEL